MCTCRCTQSEVGNSLTSEPIARDPGGPALIFSQDEMDAFLAGAKDGEFDDYTG